MRITIVSESSRHLHTCELAGELDRMDHQVTVYPAEGGLSQVPEFAADLARRWTTRRERPDVVHAHSWTGGLAAIAGSDGLGIPVVETFYRLAATARRHGETSSIERERMERAIGRTADMVIAMSEAQHAELIRLGVRRHRLAVVPGGVDTARFASRMPKPVDRGTARLVTLSDLGRGGGVDTLIEALPRIPGAELVVAGGPPAADLDIDEDVHRLRIAAKEAGVAERVAFAGAIPHKDVPRLLRSAHLTVSPAAHNAFGLAAVESMACGVPVVATAMGGHLDTVIDNVTGILVPPGARAVEWAGRIRDLLAEPTLRAALSVAGVDRARSRYTWERIAKETLNVYETALTSTSAAHAA